MGFPLYPLPFTIHPSKPFTTRQAARTQHSKPETMDLLQNYLSETWLLIAEMGPYLLLGFLVAGALHRWISEAWIESKLGKPGLKSIVLASLVGVPMPLCSCGVIPVTASLRDKGASKGAAASFLTSTPQTGVDSILATWGMLGPVFAIYRVIVAFVSGIAVGTLVDRFGAQEISPASPKSNPHEKKPTWAESLRYGMLTMPADIAASLTIGFLLAGIISALAPDNLLANLPGGVYSSILLTTLIAVPFYICSTGSIPLALALIASG
ncbi:MAG: permease, partial [Verrucomicrobiia bacterium]